MCADVLSVCIQSKCSCFYPGFCLSLQWVCLMVCVEIITSSSHCLHLERVYVCVLVGRVHCGETKRRCKTRGLQKTQLTWRERLERGREQANKSRVKKGRGSQPSTRYLSLSFSLEFSTVTPPLRTVGLWIYSWPNDCFSGHDGCKLLCHLVNVGS